ncbi:hypothetical protein P7F88_14680 [Vibrio hannami]|uniref:hypothetical protein n=1 Tax=Vibrio hannami TaxID=2717094 RepID=UPI002410B35C|nr:hypothetical protein [Vibrio hannami]MDG3087253.1 hypothetical protein [Vibrio hannami]
MLRQSLFSIALLLLSNCAVASEVMPGEKGKFIVELGPIELGELNIDSTCNDTTCFYRARAKGSFMFIGADVNEKGSYMREGERVVPISTDYQEKIGSKEKAYSYDFVGKEIQNKRKDELIELPENAYTFMPLLNQVLLDLLNGGPKPEYEYLSKHKHRTALITNYTKKTTDDGVMHRFIGRQKDKDKKNKKVVFYFLQKGDFIGLQKVSYGGFYLTRVD